MRLWFWLVELPAAIVTVWIALYRWLLIAIIIGTFIGTLVGVGRLLTLY